MTHAAVLDIIPTHYLYTHVTLEFVNAYYHWFSYLRRAPTPENELKATNDAQLARATSDVQREYLRTMTDPATIHAMCEDYRASASIDLKYDEADLQKKIACPLLRALGSEGRDGNACTMCWASGKSAARTCSASRCRAGTTCRRTCRIWWSRRSADS